MSLSRDEAWEHLCSWTETDSLRKHARAVEVVMRRLASRTVRVVDPEDRPVTAYALFPFRGHENLRRYVGKTQRGRHPDGRCALHGLHAGTLGVIANYAVVLLSRAARLRAARP